MVGQASVIVERCRYPHCFNMRPCPKHGNRKPSDVARGSSTKRLYGYRWQQARRRFIAEHPFCKPCMLEGRTTPTFAVDHRIQHRGNPALFWDESNWDPMCEAHHNAKSRAERKAETSQKTPVENI